MLASTVARLERSIGALSTAATARMEHELPWYSAMPADDRSWVGLVAQAGIAALVEWVRDPATQRGVSVDVFGTAPRELARSVTLQQTVELVRLTIAVVEEAIPSLADPPEQAPLREAVLRYSREVAFAAAQVYAEAAEARGAWDARLEALVVDALLRGEVDEATRSRAAALGWPAGRASVAVVGSAPAGEPQAVVDEIARAARAAGSELLAGVQGSRLSVLLALPDGQDALELVRRLLPAFAPGPVVVGPPADDLAGAARSARAAASGARAAGAWPECPRPATSQELLPERALDGDEEARAALVAQVAERLAGGGAVLLETLTTYLEQAGSLEGTARMLFVHPNTVRYRLRRVSELTGYAPAEPRDSFALRLALAWSRLSPPTRPPAPLSRD
ncbi:PucR-like helix-turn-helix protein [Motilibacter peucedani]|uniref:PucR-like helix-turn-helix protein n=1 Tax=Motilibacter peucedani TaxID=598650 RepID=A0A420XP22_9ACTN|nr:helix-turn-helix domain-containing protein [Motilibacter peucedani]RKS73950.1 PucR-like helix-turn-helix protein [Motilibacter peucedani]